MVRSRKGGGKVENDRATRLWNRKWLTKKNYHKRCGSVCPCGGSRFVNRAKKRLTGGSNPFVTPWMTQPLIFKQIEPAQLK